MRKMKFVPLFHRLVQVSNVRRLNNRLEIFQLKVVDK